MSSGTHRFVFIVVGLIPVLFGAILIGTAGIKGFNGTGGEDTALFQLITYMIIPAILGGLVGFVTAFRPNRLMALAAGVLLVLSGLGLALINPIYGGIFLLLGIAALVMQGRIPKK